MAKKKRRKPTVSDQIREAIDESEMTRYRISAETGIPQAVLSRFMAGKSGISSGTIDKLAELLELEVVKRSRRTKAK